MKPMSEAAKDMSKAIEYMNEHGWNQGNYVGAGGSVCMEGSLILSGGSISARGTQIDALSQAFEEQHPGRVEDHHIPTFNDHPYTTYSDVKRVMQRALVLLIQEGATS